MLELLIDVSHICRSFQSIILIFALIHPPQRRSGRSVAFGYQELFWEPKGVVAEVLVPLRLNRRLELPTLGGEEAVLGTGNDIGDGQDSSGDGDGETHDC